MATVGGDIIEITYNHPVLGTGTFFPKAGEDNTYDIGGPRSDDDANMITGAGEMIDSMKRVRPFFEAVVANDQNSRNDLDVARQLAGSPIPADWTISIINGTVWGLQGKPVGDLQGNISAATFTLKVAGSNVMKKISG
jgi:hypothetical protein